MFFACLLLTVHYSSLLFIKIYSSIILNLTLCSSFPLCQSAPILLLKDGTDTSQGKPQIISNINACEAIVDAVCSTLGPRGMDKLIVDGHGKCVHVL